MLNKMTFEQLYYLNSGWEFDTVLTIDYFGNEEMFAEHARKKYANHLVGCFNGNTVYLTKEDN